MKNSCVSIVAVIPVMLLTSCVDNRNDFAGAAPSAEVSAASDLPAPENLSASATDNEVSLSWDEVEGASAYNVYVYSVSDYIPADYSFTSLDTVSTDESTRVSFNGHLLSGLEYEVDYYFKVTALADTLESDRSNEVGIRPFQNFNNSTPYLQLFDSGANAAEVVTLSAEVSDPDGNEISYLWQQVSGESVNIEDSDQPEAYFTAPTTDVPMELGFVLTVNDGYSATNSNVVTVSISDNLAPQVDAGADQSVSAGTMVNLLGSVSDSGGSIVDITWQQQSGNIVSLSSTSSLATSFTAPSGNSSELTLVFQLSATDDSGASTTDTVTVLVAADQGSTIIYRVDVAENSNGTIHVATTIDSEQESLTYSLSGTDADDFNIDSSSGAISFVSTPDYENPTDENEDNVYELTFEVSDGTTATLQELVITVIDVNEYDVSFSALSPDSNPSANEIAEDATAGTAVGITAAASDDDGTNNTVSYSFDNNSQTSTDTLFSIASDTGVITLASGASLDHESDSSHEVVVKATSDDTSTATATFTISVTDVDEHDVGTISDNNDTTDQIAEDATAGTAVGITAAASDDDGTNNTVSYSFDNDSQTSTDTLFSIANDTGVITLASGASLDHETDDSHEVVVKATSDDTSTATATFTISVTDVDEHDVGTISDSDDDADQISEDATAGTAVGITASASDADGTDDVSYSFDNDSQTSTDTLFSIANDTGVITLASGASLDHETDDSHEVVVKATSGDTSTATATFTISVTDVDEHDVGTISDSDDDADQISEDATAGTAVGITASASDADGTDDVSYSFDNDSQTSTDTLFSIANDTGVITLASGASLDHETDDSHEVVVKATSDDTSTATTTFTISVTDVDEHDVGTISDSDDDADQISEDATAGTAVGITASASDADGTDDVSYSFDNDTQTSTDTLFSIANDTGVITLASGASLDHETDDSHEVVVKATSDDTSTATTTFTISVTDVDEHDVGTISDSDDDADQISEDATAGTAVGITASASDADGTDDVSYSFDNDTQTSTDTLFSIANDTGVITLASGASLDHETDDSHEVVVKATSDDTSTATTTFTISVTDVDEHDVGTFSVTDVDEHDVGTISDSDDDADQISEDATAGTAVGITASASDADGTDDVSYSFDNDTQTSTDTLFSIANDTGVITLASGASLDHETDDSHEVVVKATSDDTSTATTTFTISVTDVDEHDVGTISDSDDDADQISEDATAGTAVGITASASDADGTDDVSYSFDNDTQTSTDTLFSIASDTGVITLASGASLDHETDDSHEVVVKATSDDTSTATTTFTISVTDVDEHDVGTISDSDDDADQISEDATAGTAVGITASASDADGTDDVSYSFDNDTQTSTDTLFSIANDTGVITLASGASLDHETDDSHEVVVKATSDDTSTATTTFTISVTDVDEHDVGTISDSDDDADQISEDATAGTAVGITASASDADGTDDVSYSFDNDSQTSTDTLFSIANDTGVITLASGASLDHETDDSHEVVVKATSDDTSTATATFTISVTDVDEHDVGTISDSDDDADQISEDATAGTAVGIIASASDGDGTNNTVSYSFDNDLLTSGFFSIDASSGVVTLTNSNSLDYETATSHDIAVKATSSDGSSTTATFTINVTDINDNTPIITASQSFDINEDSDNGTSVGTVGFTDADSDAVNTFTWTITGGNTNDAFAIDPSTGELTVNTSSELDYESDTILYTLSLTVSDGATTSSAETVTINILDVSEHDAAPSAAYLGLPDNYINITFTPESGVSYQLHRSFVEGCTSSSCDAEGYQLFASPNSSGTADTMTFSQTHYYSLVGDNATTFTTSINDSDGAKLAALVAAQSLTTEYDLANDWVNISSTDSNNVTYTLYMAGEPFAAGGCEDSELDNIGSLCADGSSLSDGSMHSATEVINWSARRYYRLDISDGYQVVHSLESNASVIDPVLLNASNASLTIDITWSALNSSKLAEYTVYLSDDSAATTASAATWSSLSNPQIISGNSSELYSLVPILSQYYVAITATNTENETTPLSKVYLVNNIVTGDPDPSTWHEIIADTDDSPAHWEGRSTHGSLVFQDKMWLIGGRTANEAHIAEVWSSTDGYNWTEVNPSAAFGARKEFVSMVHDGKMWVLGGEIEGNLLANDVWYSSDGATWHEATPAASWHARDYFGGVSFASGATGSDEMWVLGHYTGDPIGIPGIEDHHYSTDGSTWSSVSVSGLPPSSFFPAITFNNVILIVGGYFYTNSAWSESNTIYSSTNGVNWTELSVNGSIWDARRVHTTLVYDDKLWVLAGDSGYNRDDYWYSSDGTQWHEAIASGSKWEARKVHTSVNYAGRMWMLGGEGGSTGGKQLNDVWASGLEITSFSFNSTTTN